MEKLLSEGELRRYLRNLVPLHIPGRHFLIVRISLKAKAVGTERWQQGRLGVRGCLSGDVLLTDHV